MLCSAGLALVSALLCLALAIHHPLSGTAALLLCAALALAVGREPLFGFALLPAVLPAIGLMPWTGWLTFEELDLAVLAVAAGGYARLAWRPLTPAGVAATAGATALKSLLLLAYGAALLVSMGRGFADAGGFAWGWWQGYHEPMNSLRVAKSFFLALLLLPLWRATQRAAPGRAASWLGSGLATGLAVVALLAVWERWAYTDLGNFSSDYRTTALFWEVHVGGAAFDGFLALTMPFAVREMLRPAAPWRGLLAAAGVVLGAYACLTTFSRAVYIAVPAGLMLMALLQTLAGRRLRRSLGADAAAPVGWLPALAACVLFAVAAGLVFTTSGYRGMLALLGAIALLLPMGVWLHRLPGRGWAGGLLAGLALAGLLGMLSYLLPKGPYTVYALAWAAGAALLVWAGRRAVPWPAALTGALLLTVWLGLLASMGRVAQHWGGERALAPMAGAALLLLVFAVWASRSRQTLWPASYRWQGSLMGALAAIALTLGVLFGGAYMGDRFSTGSQDLDGRFQHWTRALSLLNDPSAWAFGKGTGRYPANHFLSGRADDQTGDHRLRGEAPAQHLVLTAGKHDQGWGVFYRMSQRVPAFAGPVTLRFDARSEADTALHFEICRKHLLYDDGGCMISSASVKAMPGVWQPVSVQLPGKGLSHGDFFAPHFLTYSMAVASPGHSVELDNLRATDARGRELLVNGNFDDGMARWFFSSDRHHLPWHMKSLLLHVLFEQGAVGLVLFITLALAPLWRVTAGRARGHSLAPAIAAAIVGFQVVGLVDSLLDAPRVAFLYWFLVVVALALPARTGELRGATVPSP